MRGVLFHPREFFAQHAPGPRRARPESQLVIEPPRARSNPFVVVVADLVGFEAERFGAEHVVRHRQHPGEDVRRFAAAKGLEDVERDRGEAADREDLTVADRHAVGEAKIRVDRRNLGAALGQRADERETETRAVVDNAHVARIAIGERVEIALARHHRRPREFDDPGSVAHRDRAHGARGAADLRAQIGPCAIEWRGPVRGGRPRAPGVGAARRIRAGVQFVAGIDPVVEVLPGKRIAGHALDQAHPERRVARAFRFGADAVDRRKTGKLQLPQRSAFRHGEQERQRRADSRPASIVVAIEPQQAGQRRANQHAVAQKNR